MRVRRLALHALGVLAAALLLWLAVDANSRRSCAAMDAGHELLCAPSPNDVGGNASGLLRLRIANNPGDSDAYVALAQLSGDDSTKALAAAITLAPNNPNVLRTRAMLALEQNRLEETIASLSLFVEHYHYLDQEPARILARLVARGHATVLAQHLPQSSRWVIPVLNEVQALKLPMATALPIVARAREQGSLSTPRLGWYIRSLKAEGNWVEAYGLWAGEHGRQLPILYNADFDREFRPDGFDWEAAPSASGRFGAIAAVRPFAGRGQVLDVLYTGRSMPAPVVRQYLFLAPGHYRLTGQYMTAKLRSEAGLAWAARCTAAGHQAAAGRTAAMPDSRGAWLPFTLEFVVSETCGAVVSLQLETFAPFESETGIRGEAFFDAFAINRLALP